jgi:hypothetical protein
MKQKIQNKKEGKFNTELYTQLTIIGLIVIVIVFNLGRIYSSEDISSFVTSPGIGTVSAESIIPTGTPAVYGEELSISYNDVSPSDPGLADSTIDKFKKYEDLELTADQMERYIKVVGSISCEYCCGAKSIIFEDGKRACGCAHSYAMRGLAKYLIINHPDISDQELLSELGKWKVLFFPGIHEEKAQVLEAQGIDSSNYINLASNLYRGIEKGQASSSGMVGGC